MEIKRKSALLIAVIALIALTTIVFIFPFSFAQTPDMPVMPSTPYILPNAGADPWSQHSWQQDYCNKTGMDFLVLLDPTACSPAVVRSDLLEEQDVPVMCQLTGIKINPLIQVPYIKSIVIGVENKSKEIGFVNFWPAKTALTYSNTAFGETGDFEGVPTMNNLGYLWIQLARQPDEAKMPDSVKANLNAVITYDVAKTYGVNEHQFVLPLISQNDWLSNYKQYGFWRGKGYVRLINITGKSSAVLGVYTRPNMMPQTIEIREGQTSKELPLPGFYCGAGVTVRLDKISTPENRARLLVNGNEEIVGENEKILDSDCVVGSIKPSPGYGGIVSIKCPGKFADLVIEDLGATLEIEDYTKDAGIKEKRRQEVVAGDKIILKGLEQKEKEKKEKEQEKKYLYVIWIGKQLDKDEKLIGKVLLLGKNDGKVILSESVKKIVSAIHNYMESSRGEALTAMQEPGTELNRKLKQHLKNLEIPNADQFEFYTWAKDVKGNFVDFNIEVIEIEGPEQASYSKEIEASFKEATNQWEAIAHEYSMKSNPEQGMWYGVAALRRASELAQKLHKCNDQAEFLRKLIDKYSDSEEPEILEDVDWAREELRRAVAGSGNRFATLERPTGSYSIELLGIEKKSFAEYAVLEIEENNEIKRGRYSEEDLIGNWELIEISEDLIELRNIINVTKKRTITKGAWARLDGAKIRVIDVVKTLEAKVTILPFEKERKTEANFTVQIGIEKRAVKLSPEQTREMIKKLDKTIAQLEDINQKLNTTIGWWKKACVAGSSALWVKNFITGLSGEALARKMVMETWSDLCASQAYRKLVKKKNNIKEDISISRCYLESEDEIKEDIKLMKNALKDANDFIEKIKDKEGVMTRGGFFNLNKIIDEDKFIEEAKKEFEKESLLIYEHKELSKLSDFEKSSEGGLLSADVEIITEDGVKETRKLSEILNDEKLSRSNRNALVKTGEFVDGKALVDKFDLLHDAGWLGKDDIKEIYLDSSLYEKCQQDKTSNICSSVLKSTYEELSIYSKYAEREEEFNKVKPLFEKIGIMPYIPSISLNSVTVPAEVFILNKSRTKWLDKFFEETFLDSLLKDYANKPFAFINPEGIFMVVILKPSSENYYNILKPDGYFPIVEKNEKYTGHEILYLTKPEADWTSNDKMFDKLIQEIKSQIGQVQEADPSFYENTILSGLEPGESWNVIKFWDKGPYEGKVAYMAIEKKSGWYFATKSYTGLEGNLIAYEESGDVNAVWICNVGSDGTPNFNFARGNIGDDYCVEIFRKQLTTLDIIDPTVVAAYRKALKCASFAMAEYAAGKKEIKAKEGCPKYKIGKPPVVRPAMQCEDFMSPTDCRIMYNLCDPVMCPASRCDFGGRMPVENVIQSGIIGSIMLCLPNFEHGHGVLVPVCLTGVHAGIDSFTTVLKAGKKCLEEQLRTGRQVGICDQMMSLYICDFFWRQIDPFIRAGVPAITESLTSKGGGEYALFSESWKQSLNSARYFTEFYAVESFKSFKARSTAEIGGEFCKKFVGIAYPTQAEFWEEISQPESPASAFASFQEYPLGGPSTDSHYKVYFHIYAGKDQGVYYSVWLRKPPTTGLIPSLPEYFVPRSMGYIPAGQYIDETPDFKAPSGYKEICIRINENDFCGFQQAGTNFAMEQMQNYYVENQVEQNIRTAKECVSGSPTVFPSPASLTNIQGAVETALDPQIYRRGIIRTCASNNPGRGTPDAELWKRVGECDNKNIGCWLYQKSLNDSISDLGIRADLYEYSDQKHINWAVESLGLDPQEVSRAQVKEKEKQLMELRIKIEKIISKMHKELDEEVMTKEEYYDVIGYSEIEKDQKGEWAELTLLAKDFKLIKKKCVYPDEKVRADWAIAEIFTLKARLISLAEVVEVKKRLKEAAEEKKETCVDGMGGTWKPKDAGCIEDWPNKEEDKTSEASDEAENRGYICCVPVKKEFEFGDFAIPWTGGAKIECKDNEWKVKVKLFEWNWPPIKNPKEIAIADAKVITEEHNTIGNWNSILLSHEEYQFYTFYKHYSFPTREIGKRKVINKGDKIGDVEIGRGNFNFYVYAEDPQLVKDARKINPAVLYDLEILEEHLLEPLPNECIPSSKEYKDFSDIMAGKGFSMPSKIDEGKLAAQIESSLLAYRTKIQQEAHLNRLNENLLFSLIYYESAGDAFAISSSGCAGLGQFSCGTAKDTVSGVNEIFENVICCVNRQVDGWKCDKGWCCDPSDDRFIPGKSIEASALYLRWLIDQFSQYTYKEKFAVASYNVGIGNVQNAVKKTGKDDPSWQEVEVYLVGTTLPPNYVEDIFSYQGSIGKEELELKIAGKKNRCKNLPKGQCLLVDGCWWDSHKFYEQEAGCKQCPEKCEGKNVLWLPISDIPDLIFREKEDCEQNTCGLDCLWITMEGEEEKSCYGINKNSVKIRFEELTEEPVEEGKEQERINKLNELRILIIKHESDINSPHTQTWLYDLKLKASVLKKEIGGETYKPLISTELTAFENFYRENVFKTIKEMKNSASPRYDCADAAIVLLEMVVENYADENEKENLKLVLKNDGGSVAENYRANINAAHLAEYNTEKIEPDEVNAGDMLIYQWSSGRWHVIIVAKKLEEETGSGKKYSYYLVQGDLIDEKDVEIKDLGWAWKESKEGVSEVYNKLYEDYFLPTGSRGKSLYQDQPRKWDFDKILKVDIQPV